jgi:hypothetical protein
MVLKLAYERDEKLQEIAKKLKRMNQCTTGLLSGVASGTLAQGTVSMSVLNPPAGLEDSCVPGALGLGFSGFTNVLFATKNVFGHSYRKQIHARQVEIQQQVENVLHHLEFSKMTCPEAQHELVALIGERGARDFADLWQASHGKDENDAMAAKASEALMQISTTRQNTPQ